MSPRVTPLSERLQRHWFEPGTGLLKAHERLLLGVLEGLYRATVFLRNMVWAPLRGSRRVAGVASLAVGNLIVGGAGKTPTVLALANALTRSGREVAILSRGYKSEAERQGTRIITLEDLPHISAQVVGDEAWLLCWRTGLPVAVGKDRLESLKALKTRFPNLEIALLDDGLSQRRLRPDKTLLVMDSRGFGNRHCLPLGPLREPAENLTRFDAWVDNGFSASGRSETLPNARIELTQTNAQWICVEHWQTPQQWWALEEGLQRFRQGRLLAVAGIAVPERFFESLRALGLSVETLAMQDHDPQLVARVLAHCESRHYDFLLMTEKDAVKFFHSPCRLRPKMWALRRAAHLDTTAIERLIHGL
jgi:tetraacyldisaccharide 4'-kinase